MEHINQIFVTLACTTLFLEVVFYDQYTNLGSYTYEHTPETPLNRYRNLNLGILLANY